MHTLAPPPCPLPPRRESRCGCQSPKLQSSLLSTHRSMQPGLLQSPYFLLLCVHPPASRHSFANEDRSLGSLLTHLHSRMLSRERRREQKNQTSQLEFRGLLLANPLLIKPKLLQIHQSTPLCCNKPVSATFRIQPHCYLHLCSPPNSTPQHTSNAPSLALTTPSTLTDLTNSQLTNRNF
ncbi:hypothetical protein M758_UG188400 [Ceratodon purpureus]|nr:hypothetical protein M758_UG188400 [Ceratodon purpureus]